MKSVSIKRCVQKCNTYTGSTLTFSNLRARFSAHSLCHYRAIPVNLFGTQFETFPFSRTHMRNNTGMPLSSTFDNIVKFL